jgi:hypothetical protein
MDAVFLYPQHIKDYIDQIRRRALDMRLFETQFTPLPVGEERSTPRNTVLQRHALTVSFTVS